MIAGHRGPAVAGAVLVWAVAGGLTLVVAQSPPAPGRPLAEALQQLQAEGVHVVFSSAVVPPDLRVIDEPDAPTPRGRLDQLLEPHGLAARAGPGGVLHVVRAVTVRPPPRPRPEGSIAGRVIAAPTAAPIARARVRIDGLALEAWTDAAGAFAISRVPAGPRTVMVEAPGFGSARERVDVDEGGRCTIDWQLTPVPQLHAEHVSVTEDEPWRRDRGVGAEVDLDGRALESLPGAVADDALRAVHSLPRVSAADDLRTEFSVRGSPYRHVDVVVDGVSAQWLQHAAPGAAAAGSLTLLSALVVERATLNAGAYPRRHGDALGAELSLTLREGSRAARRFQGGLAGRRALLVGEGPLGGAPAARGSWLLAARRSLAEWPPEPAGPSSAPFGFSDALAKVVLDVGRSQQVGFTWLGGGATVDEEEDPLSPAERPAAAARVALAAVSWRSAFGPRVVLRQQASAVTQRWWNPQAGAVDPSRAANAAVQYRADVTRAFGDALVEAGVHVDRHATDVMAVGEAQSRGTSWQRGGFVHMTWAATRSLTLSPGARVTWSTLARTAAVSRWLQAEWSPRREWSVTSSVGVSQQPPGLAYLVGRPREPRLVPERASHVELGFEHRVSSSVRWQAVVFNRLESDLLRSTEPLATESIVRAGGGETGNGLRGHARGLELLVARRRALGLSGWLAYAHARARQVDPSTGARDAGIVERPHTATMAAAFRFPARVGLSATLRAASRGEMPGAFADAPSGSRLLSSAISLPAYARLDLRLDRRFSSPIGELTVFVEGLNVLDRANVAIRRGRLDPAGGEFGWFAVRLPGRRLAAGALVEFR